MTKEFEEKEEEMKKKLNEAILKERKAFAGRQKMETENLRKQHEKEIDVRRSWSKESLLTASLL